MVGPRHKKIEIQPLLPPRKQICFMGAGYVGVLTAAVMASYPINTDVTVVDSNEEKIAAWTSDPLPFNEPGLRDIIPTVRGSALRFSTDIATAIARADTIFITVDTPTMTAAEGGLNIENVLACVRKIAEVAISGKIIVIKSTVPCGTAKKMQAYLKDHARIGIVLTVISNPEFLAAGTAIFNLKRPERIVIGHAQDINGPTAAVHLSRIYEGWVQEARIKFMSHESAELTKLASNALLAQRISSINSISMICEKVGANVDQVAEACGLDSRIGPHMLQPSLGFGGSCLEKDVTALASMSESLSLREVASYWRSINAINDLQREKFLRKIRWYLHGRMYARKIAVLGCAFKQGIGDITGSRGVWLICQLLKDGVTVKLYDNTINFVDLLNSLRRSQIAKEEHLQCLEHSRSIYDACSGSIGVVIANVLDELKAAKWIGAGHTKPQSLDWRVIARSIETPKYVFDGCRVVDKPKLEELGIKVFRLGGS